jgi:hypothetical protein
MGPKKGAQLHSWAPHYGIPGLNAIKACIMEDIEEGYTGRNIYILSDSQAVTKALDSFKINSKLVWDCH